MIRVKKLEHTRAFWGVRDVTGSEAVKSTVDLLPKWIRFAETLGFSDKQGAGACTCFVCVCITESTISFSS